MKLTKKNRSSFVLMLLLGLLVGTLSWEIVERVITLFGRPIDLSIGPVGFDLRVVSVWVRINPGSFLGTVAGVLLFVKL